MTTISILGCGWLGLPLGQYLAGAGFRVKGATTQASKMSELSDADIQPYLIKLNPQIDGNTNDFFEADILVINIPPRNQNDIRDFHKKQLLAISNEASGKCGHIIFVSSTAVYPAENKEVKESDANFACLTRSGISLLDMEDVFFQNREFKTAILRFGGLYGPNRHPGKFLAGKKNLAGANNPINMTHLDDCIRIIEIIINGAFWGERFNACEQSKQNRASFYQNAAISLGLNPPSFTDEELAYKKVNSDKLIQMTGYNFLH